MELKAALGDIVAGTATDEDQQRFRRWMRGNLMQAAAHFGLTLTGQATFGYRLRSISAATVGPEGPCWLRVVVEQHRWLPDDYWTGNVDANAIVGVNKPYVLRTTEWNEPDLEVRVHADVMTLLSGRPCSATDVLRAPLDLPDAWWSELRRSLDVVRTVPTTRFDQRGKEGWHVRRVYGEQFADALRVDQFETAHGDLHWSNLISPNFGLLDWEFWGHGTAGMDAASLYCFSLLVPEMASKVHEVFADILETRAGHVAQVHMAASVIGRAEDEPEYTDLAGVLREHVQPIIDAAAPVVAKHH